jgi:hypothetical protein
VFCSNEQPSNLFTDGLPPLPREAVPCPYDRCGACNEMYRCLVDEPLQSTPLTFFTHREYVEEVKEYRKKQRRTRALRKLPFGIGGLFESGQSSRTIFEEAARQAAIAAAGRNAFAVPVNGIGPARSAEPILGSVDESESLIEAFSRDRIALSGWVAAQGQSPVRQVRIFLDSRELGALDHFEPRPPVNGSVREPAGWRTMVYLPPLNPGEYQLTVQAVDTRGNQTSFPAPRVRILE